MPTFEIREDEHGIGDVLIPRDTWSESIMEHMRKNGIEALRLSESFGFRGDDLSFLSSLSFLRSLEIYCWDAGGVNHLESLTELEVLGLQFKTKRKIDFSKLNKLRVFKATWTKGMASVLQLRCIEHLNIRNYPFEDLQPLQHMLDLRRLQLTSAKLENLLGIENLKSLSELDLYNCPRLVSVAGVDGLPDLNLELETCNAIDT